MIYSALEKKKRTDFNVIENNPEITKHNETNTANGIHKRALTYAADAAWPDNGSYFATPNFEKWTRLTYSVYCATLLVCSPSSVFTVKPYGQS
jgi:hypothetical protein